MSLPDDPGEPCELCERRTQTGCYAAFNGEIWLILPLMFLAASQRSTARWAFNQNSGLLPNKRERRNAISGLNARRSGATR